MKSKRNLKNQLVAIMATLLLMGQTLAPSMMAIAEEIETLTEQTSQSNQEEKVKEFSPEEPPESSIVTNIEESEELGTELSETANANDSPNMTEGETDMLAEFLEANGLTLSDEGKFLSSGDSSHTTYDSELFAKTFPTMARGNFAVYADPRLNLANIKIDMSNGMHEWGWYMRRAGGKVAYCTNPGIALNLGNNPGYDQVTVTDAKSIKASLIHYFGYEKASHSLRNEMMVQILVWEVISGITPTAISGEFNLSDYRSWRTSVLTKVDTFYKTVSFANTTVKLKVGESKTITDTNKAFINYKNMALGNPGNLVLTKSGNKLTIRATSSSTSGRISYGYNIDDYYRGPSLQYNHPYTQNVRTFAGTDPTWFNLNVEVEKKGNALIKKVDKDTGKALANATFKLSYSGTSVQKVSNAKGEVPLNNITGGTVVTVEEIKSPTGYVLNKTPQKVTIEPGKTKTLTFTNKKISGSVKLIKYGDQAIGTGEVNPLLKGAEFTLFNSSDKAIAKSTTNDKGEVIFTKLLYGKYVLKETKTPVGYDPVADIPVTVSEDGKVYEIKATDKIKLVAVELAKEDEETKELLSDATFKYVYLGKELEGTTNADGKLMLKNIPHGSLLTITEIKAPTGYVLNTEPISLTVDSNKVNKVTMTNKKIRGTIRLIKRADQNWNTGNVAGFLKGAEFTLFNAAGKAVDKAITNDKGEVLFANHIYGKYVVKETVSLKGTYLSKTLMLTSPKITKPMN